MANKHSFRAVVLILVEGEFEDDGVCVLEDQAENSIVDGLMVTSDRWISLSADVMTLEVDKQ